MQGRSHTRSQGMSIMRVQSQELPLSAIPLSDASTSSWASQAHIFHQPYVKGCLDCTIGVYHMSMSASVAQLDVPSYWRPGGRGFNSRRGRQHSFMETDHEIFSMIILSLPLIQEGQLSVSGKRMCTILVNCLED